MSKRVLVFLAGCGLIAGLLFLGLRSTIPSAPPSTASSMAPAPTRPAPVLTDLHTVDELKAQFNHDVGVPRLILLVSPT